MYWPKLPVLTLRSHRFILSTDCFTVHQDPEWCPGFASLLSQMLLLLVPVEVPFALAIFESILKSAVDCWQVFVLDSPIRLNSVMCPLCYWWNTNNAALKNGKFTWNGQKWMYRVIVVSMEYIDFSMRTLISSVRPIKVIVNQLVSDVIRVLLDQLSGHLSKTLNRSLSSKHDW